MAASLAACSDSPAAPSPSPGPPPPPPGTRLVRETVSSSISLTSPACSDSFRRSVDESYFVGGSQKCAEFARYSITAGEIVATLRWPVGSHLDLDLVLNDGTGSNFRQSIAANRTPESLRFVINGGTIYVFVVYLRGIDPVFLANGGKFTGEVATEFTLEIERPE
jgi:hypothetical protein